MRGGDAQTAILNAVSYTHLYLIHDNPIMRAWLWPHLAWVYALGPAAILAVGVLSGVATYAVGMAIDLARIRLLERPVMRWIRGHWGVLMLEADAILNLSLIHISATAPPVATTRAPTSGTS